VQSSHEFNPTSSYQDEKQLIQSKLNVEFNPEESNFDAMFKLEISKNKYLSNNLLQQTPDYTNSFNKLKDNP